MRAAVQVPAYPQGPCDPITMSRELTRRGALVRVGGAAYLHHLLDVVPTVSVAFHGCAAAASASVPGSSGRCPR
ncbi:DnaB-like helicase N-terminal domain-containing protein [Streptomyces sp. Midd1]|uniref:DnaB-like helicase N-terminal domain-containing protein n=1 Tax=Streptomyces sp. Midd3 TaxID=3161191 RepID=UPI0022551C55|nr:hypothetical protein [Streptomyces sp. NBC_00340]